MKNFDDTDFTDQINLVQESVKSIKKRLVDAMERFNLKNSRELSVQASEILTNLDVAIFNSNWPAALESSCASHAMIADAIQDAHNACITAQRLLSAIEDVEYR